VSTAEDDTWHYIYLYLKSLKKKKIEKKKKEEGWLSHPPLPPWEWPVWGGRTTPVGHGTGQGPKPIFFIFYFIFSAMVWPATPFFSFFFNYF
jgi:hypothetical protein